MAEKDRMRTHEIRVKVTEDELRIAKGKAEMAGTNTSEFVRKAIIDCFVICRDNKDLILRMSDELNAIGNNINQIAHKVNSTGRVFDEDIKNIKNEFVEIESAIMNYLYDYES